MNKVLKNAASSLFVCFFASTMMVAQTKSSPLMSSYPKYDFNASQFAHPARIFFPFARWWWPGNDVTNEELKRELNNFAANAYGGVEVQTMSLFVPMPDKETREKVLSWDTPSYYEHLNTVMDEAQKLGLTVDMTNGSGWPTGGAYLDVTDGMTTLDCSSADVEGGKLIQMKLPELKNNKTGVSPNLVAVVAVKPLSGDVEKNKTVKLDPSSTVVLTSAVSGNSLSWNAPSGTWRIIAFWSRPQEKAGSMTASSKQGPVLDLLDSAKVEKSNEYLFGKRTGLEKYYGKPMRSIFTDSYEFAVDRHFNNAFMSHFKQHRGYDATPWLAANMQKQYNFTSWKKTSSTPEYTFGDIDWRLRYDYDKTVSEEFLDNFIKHSSHWAEQRGLVFRTQAYGMNIDMIACAGYATQPETESMLGMDAAMKVMASGAHLYNRPVLSAESVVFSGRAYTTTPQKTRIAVDKLFSNGVNQIIYHGFPYRLLTKDTRDEGWYTFLSGGVNFSSDFGEGYLYKDYQKEVNEYVGRTQYALRSGKPHADVLIYFPFAQADQIPANPEEILTNGILPDVDPVPAQNNTAADNQTPNEVKDWMLKAYKFINKLQSNGITWDWVNDESVLAASVDRKSGDLTIRGNRYQALVVADRPYLELATAKKIEALSKAGMKLLLVGEIPAKQPSFLNYVENDKLTAAAMKNAAGQKSATHIASGETCGKWIATLKQPVRFGGEYTFLRQVDREMSDGSTIRFFWNKTNQWQPIRLVLDAKYTGAQWLDAENGTVTSANARKVSIVLPPYGTRMLYATTKAKIAKALLQSPAQDEYQGRDVLALDKWNITSGKASASDAALFDWKDNDSFKYSSEQGNYQATFTLDNLSAGKHYFIDLGKVCFTAELTVNGKSVGHRINAPYSFDVTNYLQKGNNTVEVRVIPAQLNGMVGKSVAGDKRYDSFKTNRGLMSSGLIGPVVIKEK